MDDLALRVRKRVQKLGHPSRQFHLHQLRLRTVSQVLDVGHLRDRLGAIARRRPVGIGHLVRSDAVHKGKKRPALVAVTGQSREHRETHLLRYIIRRGERLFLAADAGTAVPHHQRTDPAEHALHGISLTVDRSTD